MDDRLEGLSRSVEDYLKAIFALTERDDVASTSSIAQMLEVQPASVTGMVKRLAEASFLEHVPYRGVRLTDQGLREALSVIRRHRILETYLVNQLGYAWEDVHAEAERLEHAASNNLIERMADRLENPSHDPHGAPIPTRSGEIEATGFATLADAPVGVEVLIRAVADEDAARLRDMEASGLVPGVTVLVLEQNLREGSVTIRTGGDAGERRLVRRELASRIYLGWRGESSAEGATP